MDLFEAVLRPWLEDLAGRRLTPAELVRRSRLLATLAAVAPDGALINLLLAAGDTTPFTGEEYVTFARAAAHNEELEYELLECHPHPLPPEAVTVLLRARLADDGEIVDLLARGVTDEQLAEVGVEDLTAHVETVCGTDAAPVLLDAAVEGAGLSGATRGRLLARYVELAGDRGGRESPEELTGLVDVPACAAVLAGCSNSPRLLLRIVTGTSDPETFAAALARLDRCYGGPSKWPPVSLLAVLRHPLAGDGPLVAALRDRLEHLASGSGSTAAALAVAAGTGELGPDVVRYLRGRAGAWATAADTLTQRLLDDISELDTAGRATLLVVAADWHGSYDDLLAAARALDVTGAA